MQGPAREANIPHFPPRCNTRASRTSPGGMSYRAEGILGILGILGIWFCRRKWFELAAAAAGRKVILGLLGILGIYFSTPLELQKGSDPASEAAEKNGGNFGGNRKNVIL